jgi:branched-chain amino acid transport system ATP-binding protein
MANLEEVNSSNVSTRNREIEAGNKAKIRIENLSLSFGGVRALTDISIDINEREILAIIGPTVQKDLRAELLNGFYKPQKGEIYFGDKRITRIRPDRQPRWA